MLPATATWYFVFLFIGVRCSLFSSARLRLRLCIICKQLSDYCTARRIKNKVERVEVEDRVLNVSDVRCPVFSTVVLFGLRKKTTVSCKSCELRVK